MSNSYFWNRNSLKQNNCTSSKCYCFFSKRHIIWNFFIFSSPFLWLISSNSYSFSLPYSYISVISLSLSPTIFTLFSSNSLCSVSRKRWQISPRRVALSFSKKRKLIRERKRSERRRPRWGTFLESLRLLQDISLPKNTFCSFLAQVFWQNTICFLKTLFCFLSFSGLSWEPARAQCNIVKSKNWNQSSPVN